MKRTGLQFDPVEHRYYYNGLWIPNVTSILEVMVDYSMVPGPVLEAAALRGNAVHTACHYYNEGDLDWSTLDEDWFGYVSAYIAFLDDTGFHVEHSERRVFHRPLRYAGTLDLAGVFRKVWPDRRALGDIKTTAVMHPVVALQTAAYAEALHRELKAKDRYTHRFTLQLQRDGTYNIEWHEAAHDFQRFAACLTLYTWRVQHEQLLAA